MPQSKPQKWIIYAVMISLMMMILMVKMIPKHNKKHLFTYPKLINKKIKW